MIFVARAEVAGTISSAGRPDPVTLNADYVRESIHLAYASTVHGVQGETSDHARLHLTDMTEAAALYVGMTRGRRSNTVHIVARTFYQAREQWGLPPAVVTGATSGSARPGTCNSGCRSGQLLDRETRPWIRGRSSTS